MNNRIRSFFSVRNAVMVGVLAVASALTLTAFAQGHGGMGGLMGGRMIERMLDHVNATADQRAQIKSITDTTMADMKAQREAGRALRQQSLQVFTAPNVDANAVEALRQQQLAQHDQASRRVSQALIEISRVLTPEQRKQLADHMAKRGDMMRRHMQEREQLDGARKS